MMGISDMLLNVVQYYRRIIWDLVTVSNGLGCNRNVWRDLVACTHSHKLNKVVESPCVLGLVDGITVKCEL